MDVERSGAQLRLSTPEECSRLAVRGAMVRSFNACAYPDQIGVYARGLFWTIAARFSKDVALSVWRAEPK
jgi:hypothetical protein